MYHQLPRAVRDDSCSRLFAVETDGDERHVLHNAGNDTEESGWKMVSGDVFRPPKNAILLCVQIGSGVQIITSAFATLFFAALGKTALPPLSCSSSSESTLGILLLFHFCGLQLMLLVNTGSHTMWLPSLLLQA